MRGIWRLRKLKNRCQEQLRLILSSVCLLQNWTQALQAARREAHGVRPLETFVLRFRSGLELGMVVGGYAAYRIQFPEIYWDKCYQPTPAFVPDKGWTVIDLGANMGFFTLQATLRDKGIHVVAVEPIPAYVSVLKENIARNHLTNVQVIQAAVAERSGTQVPITIWYPASGEPMVQDVIPDDANRIETIQVAGLTIAEIFSRGNVTRCDLLKIDMEGAEYDVLNTLPDTIWSRILRVVMEIHNKPGRHSDELVKLLENKGFQVQTKSKLAWAVRPMPTS